MIKIILTFVIIGSTAIMSGCKSEKIVVIETESNKIEHQPVNASGFSGKTYIWENWTYSTNRVCR